MPHMQEAREAFESNRVWASAALGVKPQYEAQRCWTMRAVSSQRFGSAASKLAELWAFLLRAALRGQTRTQRLNSALLSASARATPPTEASLFSVARILGPRGASPTPCKGLPHKKR